MKTYVGIRSGPDIAVMVNGRPLDLHLDWRSHNPGGFDWGHDGPGSDQLALAILADYFGPSFRSLVCTRYKKFGLNIVRNLPYEGWELTGERIEKWLVEQESGSLQKSIKF